jgi:hypothetical protein
MVALDGAGRSADDAVEKRQRRGRLEAIASITARGNSKGARVGAHGEIGGRCLVKL